MKYGFDAGSFSLALKIAVKASGLRRASKATGICFSRLSALCNGKGVPSVDTYFKCCRWMGVSILQFQQY